MAWTDTENATQGGASAGSAEITLNGVTAGSMIAVGCIAWRSQGAPTSITVSDGTNGTYTNGPFVSSGSIAAAIRFFPNSAAGNLTITIDPAGGAPDSYDIFVVVREFAGGDTAAPADVSNSGTGTGTTADPGTIVPVDDALVIAMLNFDAEGTITENAASEGFTLAGESELPGSGLQPGSMVFRIFAGDPGTVGHTWSLGASAAWAAVIASFKIPDAGGGGLETELMDSDAPHTFGGGLQTAAY